MPIKIDNSYQRQSTREAAAFVEELDKASTSKGTFDSAASEDFLTNSLSRNDVKVPTHFQEVLDEAKPEQRQMLARAILDSVGEYNTAHGTACPSDLIEQALHNAYAMTEKALMDSATNLHHDQLSLQPNRAVVAIVATFSAAIPWAHYLPSDIKSNEARLAILTHHAGSKSGAYEQGELIDGIRSGERYLSSSRINTSKPEASENKVKGKITLNQKTRDTCDPNGKVVKLLRGRTMVYVEGFPAGGEAQNNVSGSGNSAIAGAVTLKGTTYQLSGHINTDTGEYEISSTPDLPKELSVTVEGFIDYEAAQEDDLITPKMDVSANVFRLYAKPWRGMTRNSIDARTQLSNELGLDPLSEAVYSFQVQIANERHYDAIEKGLRLARNNQATFDWGKARKYHDSSRAEVWRDLTAPLGALSQEMAERTMDHGITHLYVGKHVKAQLEALPNPEFISSGVTERPGIYRIGKLFGRFDVYYLPKILEDSEEKSQILCVGRGSDVCRNPIVLGDAVPPIILPLAVNADLRQGAGFYARNFTEVNPWAPAANGFALIDVINMNE